jgi:predicted HicB family RNase H-like nuclease
MATTMKIQGTLTFGPHKGYGGAATYDDDSGFFHGEVVGLRDVVTFQGETPALAAKAFAESVDDYLAFCKERGEDPEQPFSGKFVTRVEPSLHKQLSQQAQLHGLSLNGFVVTVLREAVSGERTKLRQSKQTTYRTKSAPKIAAKNN